MVAHAERLAVAPRGSGSSLGLGHPPRRLDLVLDLSRLDAIEEYVPEDMVASVGAGARLGALAERFGAHRQMLAVDPPGGAVRSVGGVLATGASGPLRFRYGRTRDLLLGVRFVQADGLLTWGGAKVVKSVTGYDVPKLLVGSLGTLGVIVRRRSGCTRARPRPGRGWCRSRHGRRPRASSRRSSTRRSSPIASPCSTARPAPAERPRPPRARWCRWRARPRPWRARARRSGGWRRGTPPTRRPRPSRPGRTRPAPSGGPRRSWSRARSSGWPTGPSKSRAPPPVPARPGPSPRRRATA